MNLADYAPRIDYSAPRPDVPQPPPVRTTMAPPAEVEFLLKPICADGGRYPDDATGDDGDKCAACAWHRIHHKCRAFRGMIERGSQPRRAGWR